MGRKFWAAAGFACGILGCCSEPQGERFVTEGINPAFSPDGRRIAFQRLVEGEFHLGVVAATGGEVELNNYTYSMMNQTYNLAQLEDGSIRVDYAIGKIEKAFLLPTAINVDRYTEFTGIDAPDNRILGLSITFSLQHRIKDSLVDHIAQIINERGENDRENSQHKDTVDHPA